MVSGTDHAAVPTPIVSSGHVPETVHDDDRKPPAPTELTIVRVLRNVALVLWDHRARSGAALRSEHRIFDLQFVLAEEIDTWLNEGAYLLLGNHLEGTKRAIGGQPFELPRELRRRFKKVQVHTNKALMHGGPFADEKRFGDELTHGRRVDRYGDRLRHHHRDPYVGICLVAVPKGSADLKAVKGRGEGLWHSDRDRPVSGRSPRQHQRKQERLTESAPSRVPP